eukprot:gene5634-9450_t
MTTLQELKMKQDQDKEETIKTMFNGYGETKTDVLEFKEFKVFYKNLLKSTQNISNQELKKIDFNQIFDEIDPHNFGVVEFDDFYSWWKIQQPDTFNDSFESGSDILSEFDSNYDNEELRNKLDQLAPPPSKIYSYEETEFYEEPVGVIDTVLVNLPSTEFTIIVCFILILFVFFVDDYTFLTPFASLFNIKLE